VEITILVESTDPLVGRVVATLGDVANHPRTDASFMGWLGLLRVLDDVIGSTSSPPSIPMRRSPTRSVE
jgi:hypothetical protein